jgi:hypothetical protein
MNNYLHTDKMEMIWIIYVSSLISNPNFKDEKEMAQKRILYFLDQLNKLLLHDSRSIRIICLHLYATLFRYYKKLNTKYETKNYQMV